MNLKILASLLLSCVFALSGFFTQELSYADAGQVSAVKTKKVSMRHHHKIRRVASGLTCKDWNLDYYFEGADNAYAKGQYTKARSMYGCVLNLTQKWPNYTPELSLAMQRLARMEAKVGNYAKAEGMLKQLIALDEKEMGPYFRDVGVDAYLLGSLSHQQGRLDDAQRYYEQAMTVFEKQTGPFDRDMIHLMNSLATLYREGGRDQEAAQLEGRARVMEAHDIDHPVLRI
jgi:tetratricopeptide (TPR) repeat protein